MKVFKNQFNYIFILHRRFLFLYFQVLTEVLKVEAIPLFPRTPPGGPPPPALYPGNPLLPIGLNLPP